MYIYRITNTVNNKIYIGQTHNFKQRIYKHFFLARNGTKRHLYNAIRYYGEDKFKSEILEECSEEDASKREQYWIKFFKTTDKRYGYNKTDGGEMSNSWKYNTHKDHTRRLIGAKTKGHRVNRVAIEKIRQLRLGTKLTDEQKKQISKTLKEKYANGELKIHVPPHYDMTGYKHTDETRQKMSHSKLNKTYEEIYGDKANSMREKCSMKWQGERNPNYKDIPIDSIITLIKNGMSLKDIALQFEVTPQTLWYKLKKLNLSFTKIKEELKDENIL